VADDVSDVDGGQSGSDGFVDLPRTRRADCSRPERQWCRPSLTLLIVRSIIAANHHHSSSSSSSSSLLTLAAAQPRPSPRCPITEVQKLWHILKSFVVPTGAVAKAMGGRAMAKTKVAVPVVLHTNTADCGQIHRCVTEEVDTVAVGQSRPCWDDRWWHVDWWTSSSATRITLLFGNLTHECSSNSLVCVVHRQCWKNVAFWKKSSSFLEKKFQLFQVLQISVYRENRTHYYNPVETFTLFATPCLNKNVPLLFFK